MDTACEARLPFEDDRLWIESVRPWLSLRGTGFRFEANGFAVSWESDGRAQPLEVLSQAARPATTVELRIGRQPRRTLPEIVDEYCPPPGIDVVRTRIAVRLMAEADGSLVSRSQAKRLLAGLDQFVPVELDFEGVAEIAQGFADEVFRVWTKTHPAVALEALNASEAVARMPRHVGFNA